jgi:hypothetical protein
MTKFHQNLFSLVNSTNIYISSNKFVMNGAISMEVRFNTFPLSSWWDNYLFQFLRIWAIAHLRGMLWKCQFNSEPAAWCLDLCLYFAVFRAFCALSQVPREQLNTNCIRWIRSNRYNFSRSKRGTHDRVHPTEVLVGFRQELKGSSKKGL